MMGFLASFWPEIIGLLTAAIGALSLYRKGRKDERANALEEHHERVEKGRKAVRQGRRTGDPDERVRHNDDRW